jgi:molybdopterin molybdotransferase
MISVEEALQKVLGEISVLEAESSPILDTLGQVLAEDIKSDINVPPLDNSAMDGYAIRSADTIGASENTPRYLKVIDTVIAGSISKKEVIPGTAIRIMTGAPIPIGTDTVVQFELTNEEKNTDSTKIGILEEIRPDLNIRRAGEDIARGTLARPQ